MKRARPLGTTVRSCGTTNERHPAMDPEGDLTVAPKYGRP